MTRRLVAHVAIAYLLAASLPFTANAATTATAAKAKGHTSHAAHMAKPPAAPRVDLNAASESELATLPGIDATMAQKIVSMRPFKSTGQLVAKGIVTKEEFSKIRSHVTAKPSAMQSKAPETKAPGSAEGTTK